MNPKIFILITLVLAVVGSYVITQTRNNSSTITPGYQVPESLDSNTETAMQNNESRYSEYSKDAFDSAKGKKRVYYFHAPWCPTCIPTDKEFKANLGSIPEDVVLFKTDYDSSVELKNLFSITYQHTFVLVDDNGDAIKKWNGGGIDQLVANTQ